MGGCRCSYKNCQRATNNSDVEFHFFHYPVKDANRCKKWIENAKQPHFEQFPSSKLRNKVVCELHFELRCFTNSLKKRLIHDAVPTLDGGASESGSDDEMKTLNMNLHLTKSDKNCTVFSFNSTQNAKEESIESYIIHEGDVIPLNEPSGSSLAELETASEEVKDSPESEYISPDWCEPPVPDADMEMSLLSPKMEIISKSIDMEDFADELPPVAQTPEEDPLDGCGNQTICFGNMNSNDLEVINRRISMLERAVHDNGSPKKGKKSKVLSKRLNNRQLLHQLQFKIPASLLTVVSLHLYKKNLKKTKAQEEHLKKLYASTGPWGYSKLIKQMKWNLPPIEAIQRIPNSEK